MAIPREQLLAHISQSDLLAFLREASFGIRTSGSRDEALVFDHVAELLGDFGLQITRHSLPAFVGMPQSASIEVLGITKGKFEAHGYALSPDTPDAGIVGELIDGQASTVDEAEQIVLLAGRATPTLVHAHRGTGARALVFVDGEVVREGCVSPVWGSPTPDTQPLLPQVPVIGIPRHVGEHLKSLISRGPVTVRVKSHGDCGWTPIPILTADLSSSESDEYVLFSGHIDGWHSGAMDNASATAVQLALAQELAKHRHDLRRGLRFAFWSGHSHARYAGSAWYADHYWRDLHERCICHVNIDSVGAVGANRITAPTMAESYAFGANMVNAVTGSTLAYDRIGRHSDQSFWGIGISSLFATMSEQGPGQSIESQVTSTTGPTIEPLGSWWHTDADTIDKIDPNNLQRDARIYAATLWELATLERLPFDYGAMIAEIRDELTLIAGAGDDPLMLTSLVDQAADLERSVVRRFGSLDALAANQMGLGLSRTLIPAAYTAAGPFHHDLALPARPMPGLAPASELIGLGRQNERYLMLETKLIRERNRVEAALADARALVD